MINDDIDYIAKSKTDHLYIYPAKNATGAYARLIGDSKQLICEIDVTPRSKLAISAFFVQNRADFDTFKITKLKFHKTRGWLEDGHVHVNHFQIAQMKEFVSIISSLDLRDAKKTRIALDGIHVNALGVLLSSSKGAAFIKVLETSPDLRQDIYAVAAKRSALAEFENNMAANLSEGEWQRFFECNPWIFGHGLNYVFLSKVGPKLETTTTGGAFDHSGKRADGLLLTRAEVSQYVLVEIKKSDTDLLQETAYRSGCWGVSKELSDAVTQIQKTTFDFARTRVRDELKDELGNDTGQSVYAIEPRNYLVIGNLAQVKGNTDKIACFELYRRNMRAPEILTFDELFQRASCIVQNISRETVDVGSRSDGPVRTGLDEEIPF